MKRLLLPFLFLGFITGLQAQYSEPFSTPNKGYLIGFSDDFTGVNWTLTPWSTAAMERDAEDYFSTTAAGKLESVDLDQEVCWESPLLNISTAGAVSVNVDLVWNGFDTDGMGGGCIGDYIKVMYSVNGGAYTMIPNQFGGNACATIAYPFGSSPPATGTGTVTLAGITGNTMKIRVCVFTNVTAELVQIDNVSVPQSGVTTGCAQPSVTAVMTQTGSCNPNTGSIKVTASGATPGYNVAWSGPSNGNPAGTEIANSGGMYTIPSLAAGAYTITVTDADNCTATTSSTVTTATALTLATQVLNSSCAGTSDGEINLTVTNGVPPYGYSWSNLPGSPDPEDQTGLVSSNYTVTVTDNAGCTSTTSATISVAVSGAYLETFSTPNRGYLPNFVNDFAGVNWSMSNWDNQPPAAFGRDNNDYFQTTASGQLESFDLDQEVCWLSPILNTSGSGTFLFNVPVTWNGFDNEDYVNVLYSLNSGAFIQLANAIGGGAGTIQYPFPTLDQSGSITVQKTNLTANTLQIKVCASSNSDNETVQLDNIGVPQTVSYCICPTITFTATPTGSCVGGMNGQIVVSGVTGGAAPYMYSKDNGANYQVSATFTGLAAAVYQVVVKDANGCTSGATSVTVGTVPLPSCSITFNNPPPWGADTTCANSTNNMYSAPAGMASYSWSISGQGTITSSTTGSSVSVTAGIGSSYNLFVTITNANGCTSTCSDQTPIKSSPTCTLTGPVTACGNSMGNVYTVTNGVFPIIQYTWSITGSGAFVGSTTGNSVTVTAGASGSYTVNVISRGFNACPSNCSQIVTINSASSPTITGPTMVCAGGSVTLDAGAGYTTYAWSDGGGSGQTATFSNITTTSTYTVTVTSNGCTGTDTHTVVPNENPAPTITGPTSVCSGGNVMLDAGGGFNTYLWSNGGGSGQTATFTNITSPTVYTVTVTGAGGCTGTDSHTVGANDNPIPTITGPTTACPGGSATLDAGAGYAMYAWSNGGGSGQMATFTNILVPTTYTVTVTTSESCTGTDTHMVTPQTCIIDFSGKIIFSNNTALGVKDANVVLAGSAVGSDLTDVNGDYFIPTLLNSGSFTLTPSKTINKLNGVTIGDAAAIQQHVAFITLITDPYKLVAADVNKSNSITVLDASIIQQSIIGNPTALAQFKTSWRFSPTSHTMLNPPWGFPEQRTYININTNQINQDFYGIKTGDVVVSYANPANFGAGEPLVLVTPNQDLHAGESVTAIFKADQLSDLAAFQLALSFDASVLQFEAIEPILDGLPLTVDNFGTYNLAEGEIRVVWSQPTGLVVDEATPVFLVQFTVLQSGGLLSDALQLDENILDALSYNSSLSESDVELVFSQSSGTNNPLAAALQLQVQPNPFQKETTVSFNLPEACEAQLRVLDMNGRELLRMKNAYPAGSNSELLNLESFTAAGVLYCELVTPFGVVTRKMTVVR